MVIAAILRLVNLDLPKGLVFDEVYYAQDACVFVKLIGRYGWPQ